MKENKSGCFYWNTIYTYMQHENAVYKKSLLHDTAAVVSSCHGNSENDVMMLVFRRCQLETRRQFRTTDKRFPRHRHTLFSTTPASRRIGIGWYSFSRSTLPLWCHTTQHSKYLVSTSSDTSYTQHFLCFCLLYAAVNCFLCCRTVGWASRITPPTTGHREHRCSNI